MTSDTEKPATPADGYCPSATMQSVAFGQISDDDFVMLANMMHFADGISRGLGLEPQPPTDECILDMIRHANSGFAESGDPARIPLTDESVAAFRAHL